MKLTWTPYDLQLRHTFTISGFSRKTTPVVLTRLEYDGLTGYGEASLPPYLGETQASVIEFLKTERLVYWPARILRDILDEPDYCRELNSILHYMWENPPATAFPKTQLIRSAEGLSSAELAETVKRYLDDEDDDVRLAAIEFLMSCPEEETREDLLKCYIASEERARIRLQILEDFVDKGWTVRGFRPQVEESLPENFSLTREGKVTRIRK